MKLMSHERTISRNYSPNYGSRFSGRPDSLCRSWNLGGDPVSLLENFERYPLTFGPTPIEHLPRLTEALGGKVQIFAKREDCNSGLAMGGNKLRKLEYMVPDAIASGADTLVSTCGVPSYYPRTEAEAAAK